MTPEEELLANPNWYDGRKRSWAPGDLAQAYTLYNRLFKTNKKDTGCPSCRRQVVEALKSAYQTALKSKR
jgi:type I site-specific restriction-modification system R (restriction) subunit